MILNDRSSYPIIEKFIGDANGENVSRLGAFSSGIKLLFRLNVPKSLGASTPIFRIHRDYEWDKDIDTHLVESHETYDKYEVSFEPTGDDGLFYYTFVFPNGHGAYFTSPINNVDFELTDIDDARFCLLIYKKDFRTPDWMKKGVMYQIFPDRFCRGEGEVNYGEDSRLHEDWYNDIPEYGVKVGSFVKNNDFFGGNLWGVSEKLDYLKSLGVSVIYLNPIFEAHSNHKYDTGNYLKIDGGFGGEAAFDELIKRAKEKGIGVILDGVFNHTGDESIYFDRYNRYGGAYSNPDSRYCHWYCWKNYPKDYDSWWGVEILPRLNHNNFDCRRFFTAPGGVGENYVKKGISGWRLDVADELNDDFLDEFRKTVKGASGGEAVIIGEVWESAAQKISYGKRRRYLRGDQLDSVMNYPIRNAIISFVKNGDAECLYDTLTEIYSTYPRQVCDCLMNIIGTHDTERILTVLGGEEDIGYLNAELADKKMTAKQRENAQKRLKIASTLQFTVYGIPSLYYGDEAGMEGYHDPFCRYPFPWGREDTELLDHYKKLGKLRTTQKALDAGEFTILEHGASHIVFERAKDSERLLVAANMRGARTVLLEGSWKDALTENEYSGEITLEAPTVAILVRKG